MAAPSNRPPSLIYRTVSALWRGEGLAPSPFGRGPGRGFIARRPNQDESPSLRRSLREKKNNYRLGQLSPPNPLPEGEGIAEAQAGRVRLSLILALCAVLFALGGSVMMSTRAAEPPAVAAGLSWISDRAWLHPPISNQSFTIINNDGADAITTTFAGLAEGATISNFLGSGLNATITYAGGTNSNDVVITTAPPAATINDVTKNEGNAGPTIFDFTVNLSAASASAVTINYSTHDGTATAPSDYTAATSSIIIPPLSTTGTISITVNGDTVPELGETFTVTLDTATGATIGSPSTGTGTITNDDLTGGTYTWTGILTGANWQVAANWSPARVLPQNNDILIFNAFSPIVNSVPTEQIAALRINNNCTPTFNALGTNNPEVLTIGGGTGTDLVIESGSSLSLKTTNALKISLLSPSVGTVGGQLAFYDGAHQLTAANGATVTFTGPNAFTSDSTYSSGTNPFGVGDGTNNDSIIFESGATYNHGNGLSPFGSAANHVVKFKPGSEARFLTATGFEASGRTYSNLTLGQIDPSGVAVAAAPVSGSGDFEFDDLSLNSPASGGGSSLSYSGTAGSAIKIHGNITSNGGSGSAQDVILAGGTAGILINRTTAGTITFGHDANNTKGIEFESSASVASGTTLALGRKLLMSVSQPSAIVLSVDINGALTGDANGYVIGKLLKNFDSIVHAQTYQIGDLIAYSPIDVTNATGTGSLTINARSGKHPSISGANTLKRYWQIGNSGLTQADLKFQYNAGDVVGTEANYKIIKYDGSVTAFNPSVPIDTVNHTATLNGVTSFSDWTLGETTTVTSITRQIGNPTNQPTVTWQILFADAVNGLTASNLALAVTGLGGTPAITGVVATPGSPSTTWNVTATTGTGDGTLGLNMVNGTGLTHTVTNLPATGEVFAIDRTAPSTTSFTRQNPATSPTSADTLVFRATFSADVINVDAADFAVTGTTATVTNVGFVSTGVYDVTVSGGDLATLNGVVGLNFNGAMLNITDLAGNALPNTEPTTDETYTVTNAPATPGAALDFDGADDYVQRASRLVVGTNDLTMEAWINPATPVISDPTFFSIIAQDINGNAASQFQMALSNDHLQFILDNEADSNFVAFFSTSAIPYDTWTHVAVVRSGVHHYIYINGVLDGAATSTSVIDNQSGSDTTKHFRIGARESDSAGVSDPFHGHIDDVRIWSVARTCDEIRQLKDCELTGSEGNLVSYYKFDQGDAGGDNTSPPVTTAIDSVVPAPQNGTLNNFALTGSTSNWITPGGVVSGTSCPALVFPELDLSGNSNPIADGDSSPSVADGTDFGSVNTSSTLDHDFTMTNNGIGDLHISGITLAGTNANQFSIVSPTSFPLTVAPSTSATLTVRFAPTNAGLQSATVNIASDDCDENPYDFAIQGNGTAPEINVKGNSVSIVDGDTTPSATDDTDFGSTAVAGGMVTHTFTIENTGTSALTISSIALSGPNVGDFSLTALTPASPIPAGNSATFDVTFDPSATGLRTATVTIGNNDSDESSYDFAIQGNGTAPEINVKGNSVSIVDGDTTPSATDDTDFGSTAVAGGMVTRTFTIENTGTSALTISSISLSGTNMGDFALGALTPASPIPAGNSATFTVTFDPSATGLRTATVTIGNNDSDESSYDFAIQGTGTAPEINVKGNSVSIVDGDTTPATADDTDFGSTAVAGGLVTHTFTIENTGTSALTISSIALSGPNMGDFSLTALTPASPILAGNSATFDVTFDPSATGLRTATVTIANDDSDESSYDFAIQGTGTAPEINVKGNNVSIVDGDTTPATADDTDFGSTAVAGGTVTHTFKIENTGTSDLTISSIALSGPNVGDFSLTALTPASPISAGNSATFDVTFDPSATGLRTATVTIGNNDSDESSYDFAIQGTGNQNPTITAIPATQQQGSVSNLPIATVNDTESGAGGVTVTVTSTNPLNGVTISNIANDGSGNITADVSATCTATAASFTLTATDGGLATATATLNVTVTANTPPTLTYAPSYSVTEGNSLTITPASGPTDNGSVTSIVRQPGDTYTGGFSVDNSTGVVSISNAAPTGTHTITIRATDNCTAFTDATFDLVVNAAVCDTAPAGMIAWYPGDGNAHDITGNGNDGTLNGGVTFAPGKVDQAFSFNGTTDYVSLPNFVYGSNFSVDAWIKTVTVPTGLATIVDEIGASTSEGFQCSVSTEAGHVGQVRFYLSDNFNAVNTYSTALVNDNAFHHVACVKNGNTAQVYVDGALSGTGDVSSVTGVYDALTGGTSIGAARNGAGQFFQGLIDEVEIFNTALTGPQVAAIYNASFAGKCRTCTTPPLNMVSWWPGETNADDIGGPNNGTFAAATYAPGKVGQAFSFDGVDDFVSIPAFPATSFQSGTTLDLWFNSASFSGSYNDIVSTFDAGGPGWTLYYFQGTLRFYNGAADVLASSTVPQTNQWYHVAVVRSGDNYTMYLNGNVVSTGVSAYNNIAAPMRFSGRSNDTGLYSGLIDEVEIFNRALSATEIAAIVDAGNAGKCHTTTVQFAQANTDSFETNTVDGSHNVNIVVTRNGLDDGAVDVGYTVTDGTATTADDDYSASPANGTLHWEPGDSTTRNIVVTVIGDDRFEADETVNLTLLSPTGATLGAQSTATLTIKNDDAAPTLSIDDRSINEGTLPSGGTTPFLFTVTKSGGAGVITTVNFATADDTLGANPATGGAACGGVVDYISQNGMLTFPASGTSTSQTITIQVCKDSTFEPNETFLVNLSGETNATLADDQGLGTILNDDAPAAGFVVNTTADTDDGLCAALGTGNGCTLREAIAAANGALAAVAITFAIPANDPGHFYYMDDGVANQVTNDPAHVLVTTAANDASLPADKDPDWPHGWWSIRTLTQLPTITQKVVLDGYTQTDATTNTLTAGDNAVLRIELDGTGGGVNVTGLILTPGFSIVRGLVINRFHRDGSAVTPLGNGISAQGSSYGLTGNFIGTDVSGTLDEGNGGSGVAASSGSFTVVGGSTPDVVNLISGNDVDGVLLTNANGTQTEGNFIGTRANGTSALGNSGNGVKVSGGGSVTNSTGGPSAGQGNTIAFNGADGVSLPDANFGNSIRGNSIFSNGTTSLHLGIDLGADGVTANDAKDPDSGPNSLQNFPVITSALVTGSTKTITGTLNSTVGDSFTIDFYQNPSCDTSGNGEGKTYLGSITTAATDASGDVSFTFHPSVLTVGQVVTATATSTGAAFNTSEFSACFTVVDGTLGGAAGDIQFTSATYTVAENVAGGMAAITLTRVGGSNGSISATFSTSDGTAHQPGDYTAVNQVVTFGEGEVSMTVNVPIIDDTNPEANETVNLSLSHPSTINAARGDGLSVQTVDPYAAVLTITDNDPCPTTFTVNNNGDASDANQGDGHCDTDLGTPGDQCSLRAAIEEANALSSCGTIDINFSIGSNTITLTGVQLTIDHNVNINGPTANSVVVSGNNLSRAFLVNASRAVAISNLTLSGSNGLTGSGGAVLNSGGTLTLTNSTVSGNSTTGSGGGGLSNTGTLTLINSTVSGNNTAGGPGGGILNTGGGTLSLTNSTVSGNTASSGGVMEGGGIYNLSGTVNVRNTIIAGNSATTAGPDISGSFTSQGNNLIGKSDGGSGFTNGVNGDKVGTIASPIDPLLGALMNNGGPTFTHGLLYNSPAVDAGNDCVFTVTHCSDANIPQLTLDQRGLSRQADGDLVAGAHVDIGAYERQATESRPVPPGSNVHVDLNDVRLTFTTPAPLAAPRDGETSNGVQTNGGGNTVSITVIPVPGDAPPTSFAAFDVTPKLALLYASGGRLFLSAVDYEPGDLQHAEGSAPREWRADGSRART